MKKCKICGRYFRLLAKNRYEVVELPIGLNCLMQRETRYNAFDCPFCGCQNIYGETIKDKTNTESKQDDVISKDTVSFINCQNIASETDSEV